MTCQYFLPFRVTELKPEANVIFPLDVYMFMRINKIVRHSISVRGPYLPTV